MVLIAFPAIQNYQPTVQGDAWIIRSSISPEVYWIHFTGSNVKNILRQYGFPDKERVFQVGTSMEYERVFKRIIIELQRCQDDYEEMLVLLLRHLLITFHRELTREHILKNEYLDQEMNTAVTYFSENYNQDINIEDYAASRGMSVSWFIRNFKKYTGSTPMQFIVGIRINNAQMLLETTTYSINEISKIVGYDNQLYFSRLFHKLKGYSPQILKSTKRIPPNHQRNDLWYPLRTFAKLYNGGAIGISASFLGLRVRKTD